MDAAARPPTPRVVLVVDDEEPVRRLTARILTEAGFHVLQAQSGDEAVLMLGMLGPNAIDVVVSDIAMPGMTGVKLAATMAHQWPDIPVLLISGHRAPPPGYPGPFLPKPFTPEALLDAVTGLPPVQHA